MQGLKVSIKIKRGTEVGGRPAAGLRANGPVAFESFLRPQCTNGNWQLATSVLLLPHDFSRAPLKCVLICQEFPMLPDLTHTNPQLIRINVFVILFICTFNLYDQCFLVSRFVWQNVLLQSWFLLLSSLHSSDFLLWIFLTSGVLIWAFLLFRYAYMCKTKNLLDFCCIF